MVFCCILNQQQTYAYPNLYLPDLYQLLRHHSNNNKSIYHQCSLTFYEWYALVHFSHCYNRILDQQIKREKIDSGSWFPKFYLFYQSIIAGQEVERREKNVPPKFRASPLYQFILYKKKDPHRFNRGGPHKPPNWSWIQKKSSYST